jgi:trehalose 6-phosphate synthase
VRTQVDALNRRFGTSRWTPVVFRHEHHSPEEVGAFYRAADVCVVSSLHDGMNLVAKEFVATRSDEQGVLVLSRFTGAARSLADVVPVNPFAPDEFATAIHDALTMPPADQQRRMRSLRAEVLSHTVYDWAGHLLSEACRLAAVPR